VAHAREALRVALVGLQEAALNHDTRTVTGLLLHAAELVADATSLLFELELTPADAPNRGHDLARARDILHEVLAVLQAPDLTTAVSPTHPESVANALAVVYVVSRAEQRRAEDQLGGHLTAEPPSTKRKGLVLDPDADSVRLAADTSGQEQRAGQDAARLASRLSGQDAFGTETGTSSGRRASGRTVLEVDVGYVSESNFYAGLSMDISAGGLFVATKAPIPVGTAVTLAFMLPGGHTVTTAGAVRWVREPGDDDTVPGMGVAFQALSEVDARAIQQFAHRRAPMYHDSGDA
jgi:uncharacterized protein (TIGR02266 family)